MAKTITISETHIGSDFCDSDSKPRIKTTRPPTSINMPRMSIFAFLFFGRLNGKNISASMKEIKPRQPTITHIHCQPIESATTPAHSDAQSAAIGSIIEIMVITFYNFPGYTKVKFIGIAEGTQSPSPHAAIPLNMRIVT